MVSTQANVAADTDAHALRGRTAERPVVDPSHTHISGHERAHRSRRDMLRVVGLLGAGFAAAQARPARAAPPDVSADIDPNSQVSRLVRRITFGYSTSEAATANALGYAGYLEQQLDPGSIAEDPALETSLAALTTLNMTLPELYVQNGVSASVIINELIESKIRRAVFSKRQLFERMVEFWSDHFNIDINEDEQSVLKTVDDRSVIRPNALGTFGALVNASARSPAMLHYLNNDISTKNNPNENYGRELLELHSMSPASGYTQSDVREVARCFTGWTKYSGSTSNGANAGLFRYNHTNHDTAVKTLSPAFDIDGNFTNPVVIPANQPQMADAQRILDLVSRHPATAQFIAGKLCRRFVGENVSSGVIGAVAQTFLATNGDIKAMLRTMFAANILWDAELRFKRPFHLIASALRALPATISATSGLRTQLNRCGHMPFYWNPPDGYPDTVAYWSGSELPRWNFGASAPTSGVSGVTIDTSAATGVFSGLATSGAGAAAAHVDRLNQRMFGGEMSVFDKARLQQYLGTGTISLTMQRDVIGLAIGCPSFQWY